MRFAVDTGGTFTDLVIEDDHGTLSIHKSSTVPSDPVQGVLDVFEVAATARGTTRETLLASAGTLIHGTTRGLNAVLTGNVARTAFLTTEGHPDILLLREGGRKEIFDLAQPYPEPYVPRSLTFEVPERIDAAGNVVRALDEQSVRAIAARLREEDVEAVAVCLLWSIVNPSHEVRIGELLAECIPDIPVSLSHRVNPCIREYRRASATAIDASLRPVMTDYLSGLTTRLQHAGFTGRVLIVTSSGGALDVDDVAASPIHSLNSGPAMAPVGGRHFAALDAKSDTAIVADTGGTSYDVSVVRRGRIPWSREAWIGRPYFGHMTGFPSVDVRSVGSGGGSIAWVDSGGMLHVGPESAGADPGPVCYGRGNTRPTTTDACLVLGYLDPDYFLGGRARLDLEGARRALAHHIAKPLQLTVEQSAAAVLRVATERMVSAIEELTIHEGIDPTQAVLVGGGGAAGFNTVAIARRLGCPEVIVPALGPAISAAGALISDLSRSFEIAFPASDSKFDYEAVGAVLSRLSEDAHAFINGPGAGAVSTEIDFSVEARYPHQVWELEVPMRDGKIHGRDDLRRVCETFHEVHRLVFAVADESSPIEFQSWHARAYCRLSEPTTSEATYVPDEPRTRRVFLPDIGPVTARVWRLESTPIDEPLEGPAIVESATTTVVIDDRATFRRKPTGTLHIETGALRVVTALATGSNSRAQ